MTNESPESPGLLPLHQHYLLVIQIPVQCDAEGRRFVEALWHKDLVLHLDYIQNLSLACPRIDGPAPEGWIEIADPRIRFVDLPSRQKLTIRLPQTIGRLWVAIGQADVVHSALGDWLPISIGNLTALFAKMRGKFFFVIVESSPWRLVPGTTSSRLTRIKASLSELVNRWCIGIVDLAIFTQAEYKASLMRRGLERGHVIHASWIDEADLLSTATATKDWQSKRLDKSEPLRVLFAGRLTEAKGVASMLEAIDRAEVEGLAIRLDILGDGDLRDRCEIAAATPRKSTRVEVLSIIPYGPRFFHCIRKYHAILVPSITDEQPRIVYDAYSQAIPVLASDTPGLRDCVVANETGLLFSANDARSMLRCLRLAMRSKGELAEMGFSGLERARRMTHRNMHRQRWILLDSHLRPRL